jgi:hypothetical protein
MARMGRLRALCAVLFAIALVASATIVRAKPGAKAPAATASVAPPPPPPPPASPEEAEARRHFEIGLKLYAEKAFDAALIEFEASYKLNARPSALRNVAQCSRDLKHFAEAHDTYERLLTVHASQLSPAEKAAVVKAIKDLEIVTGSVDLKVNEAGANVQVDDRAVGTTPLDKPVRVDVGKHVIKVFKSGFEPAERPVEIIAQVSVGLDVTLVKEVKTGHVTIREETGKDVHVFVDDVDVGPAPWTGDLAAGPHSVELKGDKYAAQQRNIDVVTKGTFDIAIEALPLLGHLKIQTLGKIGALFVDDKKVGDGVWEGDLPPGSYEVSVTAKGYQPYKHLVSVTKGQLVEEDVTLVAVPPPPPPPPPPVPQVDPYVGLYAKLSVLGLFPLSGQPSLDPCSTSAAPSCSKSGFDMRLGPRLNVGYAWGVFGFEFVGAFLIDLPHEIDRHVPGKGASSGTINLDTDDTFGRDESHKLSGWAIFSGIGPRVTSKDDAVRFTFGGAFGGVYRVTSYKLDLAGSTYSAPDVTGFAPALMVDAGLLLGSTPGLKFNIGVTAWLELTQSRTADPWGAGAFPTSGTVHAVPRSQEVITGPQFFIGPTLGFQFGR